MPESEMEVLVAVLGVQRAHVVGILEGLDDEYMHRPVLPSGWSCAGLVNHLAADVEQFWFAGVISADPSVVDDAGSDGPSAWAVGADVAGADVVARYEAACSRADTILSRAHPDDPPAWWPTDLFGSWRLESVREIVLHVIAETATHAGHLDAARELIDGRRWMVIG
ncbi:MAG: DinB family protein [Acidimicrobiales bacterium]